MSNIDLPEPDPGGFNLAAELLYRDGKVYVSSIQMRSGIGLLADDAERDRFVEELAAVGRALGRTVFTEAESRQIRDHGIAAIDVMRNPERLARAVDLLLEAEAAEGGD